MNEVEIKVETIFTIDLTGNVHIKDTKFVRNVTRTEQRLRGPFKQGIRQPFENLNVYDSDGNNLRNHAKADEETSEIELFFSPPSNEFVIPPESMKSFTVEYDVFQYAEPVGGGLLVKVHSGNIKYKPDKFDHFAFSHIYEFDTGKGGNVFRRAFNRYVVHTLGFKPDIDTRDSKIIVKATGVLTRKELQTNIILLEGQFRKLLALITATGFGAGLKYGISQLVDVMLK